MITGTDKNPSFGLAADGKPANVPNGHLHVEIDTFKASLYDEENDEWYEDAGGGGGGGGGGDGGVLVVTFGGTYGLTPDKTLAEIAAAATAGQLVVFKWSLEGGTFIGLADITFSNGSMSGAEATAVSGVYDGMLSTMKYADGSWSSTEKYLS